MNEDKLYELAINNVHKYSLLNEILAIRDNRFPKEKPEHSIAVYGYIGLDVLRRYVRYIDELVEYENIDTINNCRKNKYVIEELKKWCNELGMWTVSDKIKELEEGINGNKGTN